MRQCNAAQASHRLNPRPKTIPELKRALQQIWDDLPQKTINKLGYMVSKNIPDIIDCNLK